jgi:hypothetical protein
MTSSTTVKPPQATDEDKAQALALTKRLSKNPDEVDKKLSLAKNAAPILGISAPFVYDNANVVAKRLYGPFENPGSASSKLENTVKAMPLNTKIATLQYQQLREGETPDRAQQIKDLQAQLPKDQVGGMPRFVIDAASSLGIQLGAGAVGSVTGMQAFGQGLLSKMWYVKLIPGASKALEEGAKKSLALSDEAVDTAMGSLIGGFYGELRDSGVGVKAARAASGVMLAAQTVLSALSAGKIPGVKQATEALAEASLKAVASGELARSIVIQAGKGYLEQGAIAALNNATGVLLPQFAKSLSNKVDGTDLTWDQANVIWNQFATGTLEQALAMGTVHAIGATVQGTRYAMEASKIAGEIDKTVEPSPTEAGGVKVASKGVDLGKLPNPEAERAVPFPPAEAAAAEAKAEAARTKIAKDEIAKTPISQLDVPRGTMKPTGAELASIENAPFERTSSERINDLATLEKNKVITEPQQAELDKLRSEQPAAMVSAKPPSTTERVESDPRMIKANQKVASLQDALDSARKEGKLSGVQDLAMEDALKSARQEARMTQDMLHKETTEKVKQGLVNERERVAAVAQSNQYVNNLKSLDLSHIGDEYKAPIKGILDQINLNKPTNKTLANLFDVQQQINSGVAPTSLPENYVNRLGELAKKPFRDLTLEEQKVVHDTIMAYHKAGVDSRTLLERGQAVDKQEALKALKWENIEAHPKETPKPGEFVKANTGLGSKIKSAIDHAKNSVSQYQTLVASAFGGEDSRGYQILGKAIDDGDDMRVAKSYEYSDPVVNWFKDNKLDMGAWLNETKDVDIEGFKGKLQRGQEIALAGIAAQEEGRASLLESGFSLQGDSVLGRKYKLTEASLDKLLSDMDPKEKELLGKIFDMGKRAGKDMKDTFRRMYGYDMDTLDNYYPLHRAEHKLPTEEEILHQRNSSSFTRAGVDKSHTISRVGSHNAVWLRNAGDDIMEMADSASTFVGLGEPVRNASKVLFDKDFSDHLKTQMGDNFYKQITEGLQAIAGNKKVFNGLDKWFINVRNRGIGAVLGFNFPTGAINRVLVERSLAGYVPAGDWTKGQAFVAIHPKSTHEYLMANVPLYRQIAERGLLPEMQDVSRGTGKVLDKIQKASMVPEKLGFTGATKGEMWSAITQLRREMKEGVPSQHVKRALGLTEDKFPTMTEAEKIKAEAAYAGYVTKRTHANPREMYRQNMTREGIVGLTLSTLMSEKNALLNLGIRKAMDIHTPGGGRAFAKYLAVGVFGEALAIAGIRGLANDIGQKITGKKNKTPIGERVGEELSQNTLGLIPGVAQAVYPLERAMSGTSLPVQTSPDLVSQFGDDIIATAQHVHLAMNTKNPRTANKQWGDAFDSFMSWALPLTMKIPYKHGIGDIVGAAKNMGDNP